MDIKMIIEDTKFGYTVKNCNYSEIDAKRIKQLIGDGRFVVIKNERPVDSNLLVDFYSSIGDVVKQNPDKVSACVEGSDGYLVKAGKGKLFSGKEDGELEWHCAGMNRSQGDDIVAMYMAISTTEGGNTYFSDSQTAFRDLDDDTKKMCQGIDAKYLTYTLDENLASELYKNIFNDAQTMMEFRDIDGNASYETQVKRKPLVTTHPISGASGLYFPWSVIRGFTGLPPQEQKELYRKLKKHTMDEKYVYEHKWDPYDIVLSDQHHSLHRRDAYDGYRELWRAGIVLKDQKSSIEEWSCESNVPETA